MGLMFQLVMLVSAVWLGQVAFQTGGVKPSSHRWWCKGYVSGGLPSAKAVPSRTSASSGCWGWLRFLKFLNCDSFSHLFFLKKPMVLSTVIFRFIREHYVLTRECFGGSQVYLTESERRFCGFISVSQEIAFSSSVARHRNCLVPILHMCLSYGTFVWLKQSHRCWAGA